MYGMNRIEIYTKADHETEASARRRAIELIKKSNESFCFPYVDFTDITDLVIFDYDYVESLDCYVASIVYFEASGKAYKLRFYSQEITELSE